MKPMKTLYAVDPLGTRIREQAHSFEIDEDNRVVLTSAVIIPHMDSTRRIETHLLEAACHYDSDNIYGSGQPLKTFRNILKSGSLSYHGYNSVICARIILPGNEEEPTICFHIEEIAVSSHDYISFSETEAYEKEMTAYMLFCLRVANIEAMKPLFSFKHIDMTSRTSLVEGITAAASRMFNIAASSYATDNKIPRIQREKGNHVSLYTKPLFYPHAFINFINLLCHLRGEYIFYSKEFIRDTLGERCITE